MVVVVLMVIAGIQVVGSDKVDHCGAHVDGRGDVNDDDDGSDGGDTGEGDTDGVFEKVVINGVGVIEM